MAPNTRLHGHSGTKYTDYFHRRDQLRLPFWAIQLIDSLTSNVPNAPHPPRTKGYEVGSHKAADICTIRRAAISKSMTTAQQRDGSYIGHLPASKYKNTPMVPLRSVSSQIASRTAPRTRTEIKSAIFKGYRSNPRPAQVTNIKHRSSTTDTSTLRDLALHLPFFPSQNASAIPLSPASSDNFLPATNKLGFATTSSPHAIKSPTN